jgi:hypothetical protein
MLESEIERHLKILVASRGGFAIKWIPVEKRGWPDRIVVFPDRPAVFVELKAPGEKPRAQQVLRHQELERLGFQVFTCDSKESNERVVSEILAAPLSGLRD